MFLASIASALNVRLEPASSAQAVSEMRAGDLFECDADQLKNVWVKGTISTGINSGRAGYVRRKWLVQHFDAQPVLASLDRRAAAEIIDRRSQQFDSVHYGLGNKAEKFETLDKNGRIDCSGWVYLLAKDILAKYAKQVRPSFLVTHSDGQIVGAGAKTGALISHQWLTDAMFAPGCIVGIDFAEYSWDRNRPLDIDHIVMVGGTEGSLNVSQSSSGGGGVNVVPLEKWLKSTDHLRQSGRMHLVDLLALANPA